MRSLQKIFQYQGKQVRTIIRDGHPWWVAKDVCEILDIQNPSDALKRLDYDERARFNLGPQGETNIVNEPGLYTLILGSRKTEAKEFKRWVTHEVIPSIRQHGVYMTPQKIEEVLLNPDTIIQLATQLKQEREEKQILQKQAQKDRPKVLFADSVQASHTSILVGELAKILRQNGIDTGQNRLFKWLRDNGYLIKRKGADYNMPTQKAMDLGLFEIKETTITHSNGYTSISKTSKVTGKGQMYFINKFLDKEEAV